MTRLIDNEIAQLIAQSKDIATEVRLENWDSVGCLTEERQRALEDFFQKPITIKDSKPIEKMIHQILEIDHNLVSIIEQEQKNTFKKFANLKNNNKAKNTYQNIASLDFS